jgi:hypothetical protein
MGVRTENLIGVPWVKGKGPPGRRPLGFGVRVEHRGRLTRLIGLFRYGVMELCPLVYWRLSCPMMAAT